MASDQRTADVDFSPRQPPSGGLKAGGLAIVVFVSGYFLPVWLLGRTYFSHSLQLLACLLAYVLVTLAIFRFLEARSARKQAALEGGGQAPSTVGLLDPMGQSENESAVVSPVHRPKEWSPEFLYQLDWKRMVDLCLAYFEGRFRCEAGGLTEDGSVDIRLFKPGEEQPVAIVHCRVWGAWEAGLDMLESLSVKMAQELVGRGFCIGFCGFSASARAFAQQHGITLIDDVMFVSMLNRLPDERRQQLLVLAGTGDFSTPSCPLCGLKMFVRQNEQVRYWGCRAYPRCQGVLAIRSPLRQH